MSRAPLPSLEREAAERNAARIRELQATLARLAAMQTPARPEARQ